MPLVPVVTSLLDEAADIAIVTVAVFVLLRTFRGSRARLALVGVAVVGLLDLAARQLSLPLTAWFFEGLFLVSVVVLVLAFQDDLKRFFERLAVWGLRGRPEPSGEAVVEILVRACFGLAAVRRGALIVVPGLDPLDAQLAGGLELDGVVSEPLLLSLFDPHSPGHDGAVVIESGRVRRFAAHLPLSSDFAELGLRGTRHAAALGLSERSDALCIVVSEERGRVSLARRGQLTPADTPDVLRRRLVEFRAEKRPAPPARKRSLQRILGRAREWAVALAVALTLWVLVVPGSEVTEATFDVPVQVVNLPSGYVLDSVTPPQVTVTVTGVRRRLFVLQSSDVSVTVDALLAQLGRRTFDLTAQSVRLPPGMTVSAIQPDRVVLDLEPTPQGNAPQQTAPQ